VLRELEPREVEPRPRAHEEDENEEVGRPEGPLDERHVDPYALESAPREDDAPTSRSEAPEPEDDWPHDLGASELDEADQPEADEIAEPEGSRDEEGAAHGDDFSSEEGESTPTLFPDRGSPPPSQASRFGRRPGRNAARGGGRRGPGA